MMEHDRHEGPYGLDPLRQPGRWEGVVSSIVTEAGPELARRRRAADVPGVLLQWARPALATAATVALLGTAASILGLPGSTTEEPPVAIAVVPASYAAWLVAGYEPTVTELVVALEEVER